MVIKYKLNYVGSDDYAYLISKILKDKNANVIKTDNGIIIYIEGNEEEIKASFAALGESLPLSIYLGEQSIEEAVAMPPNRQPLREAHYMAMDPKASGELIDPAHGRYFAPIVSVSINGVEANAPKELESLLKDAVVSLKNGDRWAIKNERDSFALSLQPSQAVLLTNLNSASLKRFEITTDEALTLSAMERPFVLKLTEDGAKLFCFANDELTLLLSKCAYDAAIDALYIHLPSKADKEISSYGIKADAPKREVLFFQGADRFFVNSEFKPDLVDGPALFFDLNSYEDFGVYAVKQKSLSKKILSPSFVGANPLLEIEKRFEFGKKLVENYKNSFAAEAEALEAAQYKKSDIENFFLALSLLLSQKEGFISLAQSANGSSIASGVKLDFLLTEDKKLDLLKCLCSILSYKLAGVENERLLYSFFESFADFLSVSEGEAKKSFEYKKICIAGDFLLSKQFVARVKAKIKHADIDFSLTRLPYDLEELRKIVG